MNFDESVLYIIVTIITTLIVGSTISFTVKKKKRKKNITKQKGVGNKSIQDSTININSKNEGEK